jgi:hypothetical protein
MTLFALLGVGLVLGMRYRVLVLFPAIAYVVAVELALGISGQQSLRAVILFAVATATSLQIGYVVGFAGRYLMTSGGRGIPLTHSRSVNRKAS